MEENLVTNAERLLQAKIALNDNQVLPLPVDLPQRRLQTTLGAALGRAEGQEGYENMLSRSGGEEDPAFVRGSRQVRGVVQRRGARHPQGQPQSAQDRVRSPVRQRARVEVLPGAAHRLQKGLA